MRLPLAVEEFLPRPTGNYPDCLRPFQSPFRLKFQAALSRYALSQRLRTFPVHQVHLAEKKRKLDCLHVHTETSLCSSPDSSVSSRRPLEVSESLAHAWFLNRPPQTLTQARKNPHEQTWLTSEMPHAQRPLLVAFVHAHLGPVHRSHHLLQHHQRKDFFLLAGLPCFFFARGTAVCALSTSQ